MRKQYGNPDSHPFFVTNPYQSIKLNHKVPIFVHCFQPMIKHETKLLAVPSILFYPQFSLRNLFLYYFDLPPVSIKTFLLSKRDKDLLKEWEKIASSLPVEARLRSFFIEWPFRWTYTRIKNNTKMKEERRLCSSTGSCEGGTAWVCAVDLVKLAHTARTTSIGWERLYR